MPFYTDPVTKTEYKFACNHCIRGHRSTNCSHNDRPLFYIRKKGRPVSQCTQCRALRKNRSLHTRCECPSRISNKGLGGPNELADLPHGMTVDAAKEFVERLNREQGGCKNCNSAHCQCDARSAQNIAPASPSPGTPLSTGSSSPYPVGFSPTFSSDSSSQMRGPMFPLSSSQYTTLHQFTGMPTFSINSFHPSQTPSLAPTLTPHIAAQVEQFQRRTEHLTASTQRLMQQEAESVRRQYREADLGPSIQVPLPDSYEPHHRLSLPTHLTSSAPVSPRHQDLIATMPAYRPTRTPVSGHSEMYNYTQDALQTLEEYPYAASLSTTFFRYPSLFEIEHRRRATLPVLKNTQSEIEKDDLSSRIAPAGDSAGSSRTTVLLSNDNNRTRTQIDQPEGTVQRFENQIDQTQVSGRSSQPEQLELNDGSASDAFISLDKMFDPWDSTDNDWLYNLHTECAKPGALCECGDSCCCPGCFTHTNNPGDRGVYHAMLGKLGAMLDTGKEQDSGSTRPCISMSERSISNGTDAKS